MLQTCVDDILMGNYTELNDTESVNNVTKQGVGGINDFKCEPFDCNGKGRCVNATCVCNPGTYRPVFVISVLLSLLNEILSFFSFWQGVKEQSFRFVRC